MTTVKLPLGIRVSAYLVHLVIAIFGTAVISFLLAKHVIDTATSVLLVALLGGIGTLASSLALSHLSLPDTDDLTDPGTPVEQEPVQPDPLAALAPVEQAITGAVATPPTTPPAAAATPAPAKTAAKKAPAKKTATKPATTKPAAAKKATATTAAAKKTAASK